MQLYGWSFGQLSMDMFAAQIKDALETRALTRDRLCFREVCRFEYADGAKMAAIVGVFYSEHEAENLQQCSFDSLDFIEAGSTVRIESPNLTPKEARHIEAQMPWTFQGPVDYRPVPSEEFEKFARFYRYFPKFSSIEA